MRTTKLGATLASLAITAGGATLLATTPAQAAAPATTPTTVQLSFTDPGTGNQYSGWRALYGDRVGTLTTVISDGTAAPTAGSATLQRRLPGHGWTTSQTDADVSDGVTFTSPKALSNATYRVQYSGGTSVDTGSGTTTWDPSTSNTVQVLTYWKFTHLGYKWHGGLDFTWHGALSPHAKHHRVVIQVKRGSWKNYKVVRTNNKGHWSVRVRSGHNHWVHYRAVVAGTKTLHKNYTLAKFRTTYSRNEPAPTARLLTRR
jgi:hypothetical protein